MMLHQGRFLLPKTPKTALNRCGLLRRYPGAVYITLINPTEKEKYIMKKLTSLLLTGALALGLLAGGSTSIISA